LVERTECVAEEAPIALYYNGQPHVVMLGTPLDVEDFALGFTVSEAIVGAVAEIAGVAVTPLPEGLEVRIEIPPERAALLETRRRNLSGRGGCGMCGTERLQQALRAPRPVAAGPLVAAAALHAALCQIRALQAINARTGAVHAAAWALPSGEVRWLREDVGRHNALDKLIGALLAAGQAPAAGFAIVTSRASYELVQKAATVGIGLLAAISAPTTLAIRLAEDTGLTLVAFARDGRHGIYTHPQRLCHGA
jgi:FdhD protein